MYVLVDTGKGETFIGFSYCGKGYVCCNPTKYHQRVILAFVGCDFIALSRPE